MKKGSISLKKTVVVEANNFIPTGSDEYERRVKRRTEAHCLGKV